jgi:hypothetical protein
MDFCEDGKDWEFPKFEALLLQSTGKEYKSGDYEATIV